MKPLPMPVRIAAGLVATAVEQARDLPRLVSELPVTAVSQALQASMRVQQRVTELAIKGDRALGSLRPVSDAPSWATFDDEEPAASSNGATVTTMRPSTATPLTDEPEPADPGAALITDTTDSTDTAGAGGVETTGVGGPTVLPGYPRMTIPQLRGRLRQLGVDELRALLDWEISHDNRPPFVTMLGNRIATLTEG